MTREEAAKKLAQAIGYDPVQPYVNEAEKWLLALTTATADEAPPSPCADCCCARVWAALVITDRTDHSAYEHVEMLKAERDALNATVEKIRAMALAPRWLTDVRGEGHNACYSQNILNVLPALAGEK